MRRRCRHLAWVLALAGVPALAACGIPVAAGPQVLPASEVPFGLLRPVATPPTEAPPAVSAASVSVYLVYGGRLLGLARQVPAPPSLRKAMDALLAGPTPAEARAGVSTALRAATVASVTQSGGRAFIGLGPDFTQAYGPSLVLAVGQLVLTATSQPGVTSVLFSFRGHPVQVPIGDGTLASRPLTSADYSALILGGLPQAPPATSMARSPEPAVPHLLGAPATPIVPIATSPALLPAPAPPSPPPPLSAPPASAPPASAPPTTGPPASSPPTTSPPRHHRHPRRGRDDQD